MTTLQLTNGTTINAALGGREDLSGSDPVVVLVHGAGMDRTVWQMQTRYLAFRGFRVVALDLPGHGKTPGDLPATVEEYAAWLVATLEAMDLDAPVHLGGHSLGSFIVLEAAADRPDLIASLLLFGIAEAMPVHPVLLEAAEANDPLAGQLMSGWAFATDSKVGSHPSPGGSMVGGTQALIERAAPGVLANDLKASSTYSGAVAAAGRMTVPTTVILGTNDKMTPVRAAAPLLAALRDAPAEVTEVVIPNCGHMMTFEAPAELRAILKSALA